MPYHQSSAVSVAIVVTAATVIVVGYRLGRIHASWRDVREAKRAVRSTRRDAMAQTVQFVAGAGLLLVTVFVVAYDADR